MSRMLLNKTAEFQRFTLDDGASAQHGRDMKRLETCAAGRAEIEAEAHALSLVKASQVAERMTVRLPRARPPEQLWRDLEAEIGRPLDQLDYDGLRHALDLVGVESLIAGERTRVLVPPKVRERVLADWQGVQPGKSLRPPHRPRLNWWVFRWRDTAVKRLRERTRELQYRGKSRDDALWQAASEIARDFHYVDEHGVEHSVQPATVIDWLEHPGRRRRK